MGKKLKPKILFIGGTPRGYELLKLMCKLGENVLFAYIMKEDDHERACRASVDIKKLCRHEHIPFTICKRIGIVQVSKISKLKPDVAFVCGWRTLISRSLYKLAPFGFLVAHDSLLPKYRGFAPLNWAIINAEKKTGVTLFKIGDGVVDSGDIFGQMSVKIGEKEAAADVYPRIINATLVLYKKWLFQLKRGNLRYYKQDESRATYTCKRTPDDGKINWNKSSAQVFNLIRALSPPYPCAWTRHNGKRILITKAALPRRQLDYAGNIPGRVVSILNNGVLVLCGKGQIILNQILTQEGKTIEARNLFSSIRITLGR